MRQAQEAMLTSAQLRAKLDECSGSRRPLLFSHMPLFRPSDAQCGGGGKDACLHADVGGVEVEVNTGGPSPGYCFGDDGGVTYKGRRQRLREWNDDVVGRETSADILRSFQPLLVVTGAQPLLAHVHPC